MTQNHQSSFQHVAIGKFCQTGSGGTPSRQKAAAYYGGTIPWVKSGELRENVITSTEESITETGLRESSAKLLPRNTLLVALYGATVGRIGVLGVEAATNQAVCYIIPDERRADRKYLFYALQSQVPTWLSKRVGGGQPNISQGIIRDTQIPLPPLSEQTRIAAILDKAAAIRDKRKDVVDRYCRFRSSVFTEFFGDPATNPYDLPVGTINDIVSEVTYGTSSKAGEAGRYPILRMNNITAQGDWELSNLKYIDLPDREVERYSVHRGDILFNRTNSKELVGKTAVFDEDEPMIYAGYLIRVRTNELATPTYLSGYLNSPHGKAVLRHMCKSIIGMANINATELRGISILIPPKAKQLQYERFVEKTRTAEAVAKRASSDANELFQVLIQQAFRGDL